MVAGSSGLVVFLPRSMRMALVTFLALGGVVAAFVVFEAGPAGGVACWAFWAWGTVVCAYRVAGFCGVVVV